ncbi:MAG: hypothetical protein RR319_01325 [Bacteroides sp.]
MISNPRFPHRVKIVRESVDANGNPILDERGDPITEVVFESECRNYPSSKTQWKADVVSSDYVISLPMHTFNIKVGDTVVVKEQIRELSGIVVDSYVNNLGANIWYNFNRN